MHLPEDLEDSSNTTKLWTWCELAAWILHSLFWTHVNKLSWQGYSWLFCNYTGTDVPWPKWAFVHVVHTWTGDQVLLKVSKSFYWRQWARTMSRHSVDIRSCVLHRHAGPREASLPTFHTGKLPPEFLQHLSSLMLSWRPMKTKISIGMKCSLAT